eukprot:356356_1
MYVINKQETIKNKQNVKIKLKIWIATVFGLGMYFLLIILYYVSISYILKLKKEDVYPLMLFISAHIVLDNTLYYYCHSAYVYDAIHDRRNRSQSLTRSWVQSMISARAGPSDDEYDDADEHEMSRSFSISETSTNHQNDQ